MHMATLCIHPGYMRAAFSRATTGRMPTATRVQRKDNGVATGQEGGYGEAYIIEGEGKQLVEQKTDLSTPLPLTHQKKSMHTHTETDRQTDTLTHSHTLTHQ